jgi:hypothetical protein
MKQGVSSQMADEASSGGFRLEHFPHVAASPQAGHEVDDNLVISADTGPVISVSMPWC